MPYVPVGIKETKKKKKNYSGIQNSQIILNVMNLINYTRYVQKVSQILQTLCFFINYLFIHEYLICLLQSNAHQILYTCAKVFFPILEELKKIIFCDLVQLPFILPQSQRRVVLSWASSVSVTRKSPRGPDLGNTVAAALLVCCFWPTILVEIEQFWYEFCGVP